MWFRIVRQQSAFTVWIWFIPPWVAIEKIPLHEWRTSFRNYPDRRLKYSLTYPFISVTRVDRDEYNLKRAHLSENLYPKALLNRTRLWEGFPGFGWADILTNARVVRLHKLDANQAGLDDAQITFLGGQQTLNITLTLFASVETGALSIPDIYWYTRACWLGGTMIAVCGILTGAMLPGACHIFFGENENFPREDPRRLTLNTNAALFHQIDALFSLPTLVITWSGGLFIAGIVTFAAAFGTAKPPSVTLTRTERVIFITISLAPGVIYMAFFWYLFVSCSIQHRRFRNNTMRSNV